MKIRNDTCILRLNKYMYLSFHLNDGSMNSLILSTFRVILYKKYLIYQQMGIHCMSKGRYVYVRLNCKLDIKQWKFFSTPFHCCTHFHMSN